MDDFDAYTTHKYEPYKAPQPARQDIPDLIAGALGVSRGTAYDMMREALAEQLAPAQPLTDEQRRRATFNICYTDSVLVTARNEAHGITKEGA